MELKGKIRMSEISKKHGDAGQCSTCGSSGHFEFSQDDGGPDYDDWIGQQDGKSVCYSCYDK